MKLVEIRKQVNEYFSKDWIRPSTSPYGVAILFARKKDGTQRMCLDFRDINQKTRPDKYPLPRIDDLLEWLVNAHCISSIDLHTILY